MERAETTQNGSRYNTHTCGMQSPIEHIKTFLQALLLSGIGGACADTHKALKDFTAYLEQENNFDPSYVGNPANVRQASKELGEEIEAAQANALAVKQFEILGGPNAGSRLDN